jgi:hypothetical protein
MSTQSSVLQGLLTGTVFYIPFLWISPEPDGQQLPNKKKENFYK